MCVCGCVRLCRIYLTQVDSSVDPVRVMVKIMIHNNCIELNSMLKKSLYI